MVFVNLEDFFLDIEFIHKNFIESLANVLKDVKLVDLDMFDYS